MRVSRLLLICLFFWFTPDFLLAQSDSEFTLVKEKGDVKIYERWITFPKSDPPIKAREVKGVFFFNNSIHAAIRLIQNEEMIKKWQSHVSEFEVYLQPDTTTWLEYSYHDIPWPVSDQDHFLEYKVYKKENGNKYFITFETKENKDLAPERKGVTRMHLSGSWTLEKINEKQTRATYRILSKPIGIPKFLTDPIIRSNMMTTIEEFIGIMEKK